MGTRKNRLAEVVLTSTHNLCFEQKYEQYQSFLSENFQFLEVKFSIYLNRRVFVMMVCLKQTTKVVLGVAIVATPNTTDQEFILTDSKSEHLVWWIWQKWIIHFGAYGKIRLSSLMHTAKNGLSRLVHMVKGNCPITKTCLVKYTENFTTKK